MDQQPETPEPVAETEPQAKPKRKRRTSFIHFSGSVVEAVKATMDKTIGAGAQEIGISRDCYGFIRKLVILHDRPRILTNDKLVISAALQNIEETRRTTKAKKLTREIVSRLWRQGQQPPSQKQNRRLDQTLVHISESCESTEDMEIPQDLTDAAAKEAVATLAASVVHIGNLIRRLLGESEGEEI